jgi:DNA-binding CsgD family transcriptional regulator
MAVRKMILLTLAVLAPCGLLIVILRCVLRSGLGERFLKGLLTMKNFARITRNLYYFYEKNTGVSHVEATPDGRFPVEQAAGLLAMHCMVLGRSPSDYVVMIPAEDEALAGLTEKAQKLLRAGHAVKGQVELTRREEEVLAGIMRSFANKEIAASLNLSERTIKFHVSSLLAKFRVRGRMELVREATRRIAGSMSMPLSIAPSETRSYALVSESYGNAARCADAVPMAKRQLM